MNKRWALPLALVSGVLVGAALAAQRRNERHHVAKRQRKGRAIAAGAHLYTPSVNLAQRYNSNVWNTATSRIPQGKQEWDLVTRLGTDVIILN